MWGFIPLYFRALSHVSPPIVLCHRVGWSALFMALVVSIRGEWKAIAPVLSSRRNVLLLCAGAVLIALNWLIFIYAIAQQHLLQASLGYFINPLFSIALGMMFLRERLRPWQWLAVSHSIRLRDQPDSARHRSPLDCRFARRLLRTLWPGAQE